MVRKKTGRFRRAGRYLSAPAAVMLLALALSGCSGSLPETPDMGTASEENERASEDVDTHGEAEDIGAVYGEICEQAVETGVTGSLDMMERIVGGLGERGYAAVDSENQVDMTRPEQRWDFCRAVDEKESAEAMVIVVTESGFRKFDLKTEGGRVNIVRGYYEYDLEGCLQNRSTVQYQADLWQYTEEGYLIFEGSYFSEENYVFTLSDTSEQTALRVAPLDEKCREMNRTCLLPVGYEQNNIFLCNWSQEDYGDLDFYDIFDRFYPIYFNRPLPYTADKNLGVGAVYQIPEDLFETVVGTYFPVDIGTLRARTIYVPETAAYEYRPRGFFESEYAEIPCPEVVDCTENQDGTVALLVNGVYPHGNTSRAFTHRVVIRPLKEGGFQYISNQMVFSDSEDTWWHSDRLTQEEWREVYRGDF